MVFSFFLFLLFLGIFSYVILKIPFFKRSNLRTSVLLGIYYIKVLAGVGITIIYTFYYKDRNTADIYKYFDDAKIICSALKENPIIYIELVFSLNEDNPEQIKYTSKMRNWSSLDAQWLNYTKTKDTNFFNSNRIITRINAILIPFSNGNIFIHVLFFSFLSFIGLFYLYKQISEYCGGNNLLILIIVFLLPSTLLWCSGTLKDTLVLSLLNILVYTLFKLKKEHLFIPHLLLILILIYFIIIIKYYVAIALIPVLIGFSIRKIFNINPIKSFLIAIIFLSVCSFILLFSSSYNIWQILIDKREEALKTAIWADAHHQMFYNTVSLKFDELILNIPTSIFNAVFRPFIWEAGNSLFIILAGLENLFILMFLLINFVRNRFQNFNKDLLFFYLIFSISAAFIIGFTTPVTGGLVRYKTVFIIYLLLSFFNCKTRVYLFHKRFLFNFEKTRIFKT